MSSPCKASVPPSQCVPNTPGNLELTILVNQLGLELQVLLLGVFKEILKVREEGDEGSRDKDSCRPSCPVLRSFLLLGFS